ncbi:MAG: hypothetical protein ABR927_18530 [Bacteroidales bacterium]|jgi:hypothetical protein
MKKIKLPDQEKKDLLNKLIKENSVKLAEDAITYLDSVNKIYAQYEFCTEYKSNWDLYVSDLISKNFPKFNKSGIYTNILLEHILTPNDIENYLNKLKSNAAKSVINKMHFVKKDFL